VLDQYSGRLFEEFGDFQFALYDEDEQEVIAEGHTLPCAWDGTTDGLGQGIDEMTAAAFEAYDAGRNATALCAMAAEIGPRFQEGGLATRMLDEMADLARDADLGHLIAPVRPSLKDRYPITPIERYMEWTQENGEPFDPWIRVHIRRGARIAKPIPRSMQIRHGRRLGTVDRHEVPEVGRGRFPPGLRRSSSTAGGCGPTGAERVDRPHVGETLALASLIGADRSGVRTCSICRGATRETAAGSSAVPAPHRQPSTRKPGSRSRARTGPARSRK
jgi:hypothetical protein